MKWRLVGGLAAIYAACAYAIFAYAINVEALWIIWFVALGFLLGICFVPKPSKLPYILSLAAPLTIVLSIVLRGLPIHELGWRNVSKVSFQDDAGNLLFEVTSPEELLRFESFGRQGRYVTLWKTGYKGCTLVVWKPEFGQTYFFHGDSIGERPGCNIQTTFIPSEDGLQEFVEDLLRKHRRK
jgi:hypothetical protein